MGPLDAGVRVLAGIPITLAGPVVAVTAAPDWGAVALPVCFMIGGGLIISGLLRMDPIYAMFGWSTARRVK